MSDEKKVAKPKPPAKPKVAKAKPAPKSKAKVAKAPAKKAAAKKLEIAAPAIAKTRKTRGSNKKAKGSFADLQKIQAQYEEAKKGAKADLKKHYEDLKKESEKIRAQYKELFNEAIESAPRTKGSVAKKSSGKGFTLDQVQSYIDQLATGGKIKIPGKNAIGVGRIRAAYDRARNKDAESVHALLR